MVIIVILRIQFRLQPYKDKVNNKIEELAIISGFLTMYWAVLMVEDDKVSGFLILLTIILIGANSYFIIQWTYFFLLSLDFNNKYYQIFVKIFGILIWKHGWNKAKSLSIHSIDTVSENCKEQEKQKTNIKKKTRRKVKFRKRVKFKSKALEIHWNI